MGIYIKGMELPKSCNDCYISNCPNDIGYTDKGRRTRSFYCPLVEIPPHGRLIDADDFKKSLSTLLQFPSNLVNGQWIVNTIREQPTIIEAEGEKA